MVHYHELQEVLLDLIHTVEVRLPDVDSSCRILLPGRPSVYKQERDTGWLPYFFIEARGQIATVTSPSVSSGEKVDDTRCWRYFYYGTFSNKRGNTMKDKERNRGIIIYCLIFVYMAETGSSVKLPRRSCSFSRHSNKLLKLPAPKPWWFLRWIISMNKVGLSSTGRVKICKR